MLQRCLPRCYGKVSHRRQHEGDIEIISCSRPADGINTIDEQCPSFPRKRPSMRLPAR
jgi:hypothetical protein